MPADSVARLRRALLPAELALLLLAMGASSCRPSSPRGGDDSRSRGSAHADPGVVDAMADQGRARVVDGADPGASEAPRPERRMALTIDDLPVGLFDTYRSPGHRREVVEALCRLLERRGAKLPVMMLAVALKVRLYSCPRRS